MKALALLAPLILLNVAQGYEYPIPGPEAGPVIPHGQLNGFQPIAGPDSPCTVARIEAQSQGRIVNHQHHHHHHGDHNLETAASLQQPVRQPTNGYLPLPPAPPLGVPAPPLGPPVAAAQVSHHQQQLPLAAPQPPFIPPRPPVPLPQLFTPAISNAQSHSSFAQSNGQQLGQQLGQQHVHHHYSVPANPLPHPPPPPPPHHHPHLPSSSQYASHFGGQQSQSFAQSSGGSSYQSLSPPPVVHPLTTGVNHLPRPVQQQHQPQPQFNNGGGYQQAAAAGNSYAGGFAHSNYDQTSGGKGGFVNVNQAVGNSYNQLNIQSSHTALNGQLGQVIRETFASAPLDPAAEKHIYVHVPPDDLEEAKHSAQAVLPQLPPKKHYKIIFIKAPSTSTSSYSQQLAAAQPQTEEKTLVYVLVKKPDEPTAEEIQSLQQASVTHHKPEVYFIKYKTRKESDGGIGAYNNELPAPPPPSPQVNEFPSDGGSIDAIDIRSGAGESGSTSGATTYSTVSSSSSATSSSSASSSFNGYSAYDVPLN